MKVVTTPFLLTRTQRIITAVDALPAVGTFYNVRGQDAVRRQQEWMIV